MTAWWTSTTSVKKVRVRSIEKFRALALGVARISAAAMVCEIDDMRAPSVVARDVAVGNPIQQGPIVNIETAM